MKTPGLVLALIFLAAPVAQAASKRGAAAELSAWRKAAVKGDVDALVARLEGGPPIVVRRVGGPPTMPAEQTYDAAALRQALTSDDPHRFSRVGLDKRLLLPRAGSLKRDEAPDRLRAEDRRCPEVAWIFAQVAGRWRLVEIVRAYLEC